jgi:hypothetical protein
MYRTAEWNVDLARKRYDHGLTYSAITDRCGTTEAAVAHQAHRNWPARPGGRGTPRWGAAYGPDRLWGADASMVQTVKDRRVWVFAALDHFNSEVVGHYVSTDGSRFAALEPVSQAVIP